MSRIYREKLGDTVIEGPLGVSLRYNADGLVSPAPAPTWPSITGDPFSRTYVVIDQTIDLAGEDELAPVVVATALGPVRYVAGYIEETVALVGDVTNIDVISDDKATMFSLANGGAGTKHFQFIPDVVVSNGEDDDITLGLDDAVTSGSVRVVIVYERLV